MRKTASSVEPRIVISVPGCKLISIKIKHEYYSPDEAHTPTTTYETVLTAKNHQLPPPSIRSELYDENRWGGGCWNHGGMRRECRMYSLLIHPVLHTLCGCRRFLGAMHFIRSRVSSIARDVSLSCNRERMGVVSRLFSRLTDRVYGQISADCLSWSFTQWVLVTVASPKQVKATPWFWIEFIIFWKDLWKLNTFGASLMAEDENGAAATWKTCKKWNIQLNVDEEKENVEVPTTRRNYGAYEVVNKRCSAAYFNAAYPISQII